MGIVGVNQEEMWEARSHTLRYIPGNIVRIQDAQAVEIILGGAGAVCGVGRHGRQWWDFWKQMMSTVVV